MMPGEPRTIEPALTAEEWKVKGVLDRDSEGIELSDEYGLIAAYDSGAAYVALPPHATMALANAALPEDDPRKITREDVEDERVAYHDAVIFARWAQDRGDEAMRLRAKERAARHMERAAKLAALLPPEGDV